MSEEIISKSEQWQDVEVFLKQLQESNKSLVLSMTVRIKPDEKLESNMVVMGTVPTRKILGPFEKDNILTLLEQSFAELKSRFK